MDPKLIKSAQLGDTSSLSLLLEHDPLILDRVSLSPISETPLHIATLAGRTNYAKKVLSLKPSFARELNKDGFTPLHIAAATGNTELVKELLKIGPDLCLLKDKFGLIPLHHSALKGRVYAIQELVSCCEIAVREVTAQGETALHLAVKNYQFEALKVLVKLADDEVIRTKDKDGKTILDQAMATKQVQVLELLGFQGKIDKDTTEVDLSENQFENETKATPKPTAQNGINSDTTQAQQSAEDNSKTILEQMVLVVASLIATVTYQAGLSPPQTIWKEDMKLNSKCIFHGSTSSHSCPDLNYYLFMSFNTAGFFASAFLIFLFRNKSYVQVLLPVALISMMITYITLSVSMSPNALSLLILYLITLAIFLYCILAIEVVKNVIHSIFNFASEKASEVSKMALRRHKPADISGENA